MKPDYSSVDPLVMEFRRAHRPFPVPKLTRCRGNAKASILLIAPRPNLIDLENNVPMSCPSAQSFHSVLVSNAGISTETDCLVMPGSVMPKRQTKLTVAPFKSLPLKFHSRFKLILCVGGDNFKFMFGDGKKSSLQTLANGNLIYMPAKIGKTPLMVFPEYDFLVPPWDSFPADEQWKLESLQDRATKWLVRVSEHLAIHWSKISSK
jgi:hypothetical protein